MKKIVIYSGDKMKKGIQTEDIRNELSKNNIDSYIVELNLETVKSGIMFNSLEDFVHFVKERNVKSVFVHDDHYQIEDFILGDEFLKKEERKYGQYLPEIIEDISNYNEYLSQVDFSIPCVIVIACIIEGFMCSVGISNDEVFLEQGLEFPETKLRDICFAHKDAIISQREKEYDELERLEEELNKELKQDEKFLRCTNKNLRMDYLAYFMAKNEKGKYALLVKNWKPYGIGPYNEDAKSFIESVWREIKMK